MGVCVDVAVGVPVAVDEAVIDGDDVRLAVAVAVGVCVRVPLGVAPDDKEADAVAEADDDDVDESVVDIVGVAEKLSDAVAVGVVLADGVVDAVCVAERVLVAVSDMLTVEVGVCVAVGVCDGIVQSVLAIAGFALQSIATVSAYLHVDGSDAAVKVAAEPAAPHTYVRFVVRGEPLHVAPPVRYIYTYCCPDGHVVFGPKAPHPL